MLPPEPPFFVLRAHGGVPTVLIGRSVPAPMEHVEKAYELDDQAQAVVKAACVLGDMVPPVGSVAAFANPLLTDEWRESVAKLAKREPGSVVLLCSAPGGVPVDLAEIAKAVDSCGQHWIVDAGTASPLEAFSGRAWLFKVAGLTGRSFASSLEPPADDRVTDVVRPYGTPRQLEEQTIARRVKLLRKADDPGEQRIVLGIVLQPEIVDTQGDVYDADEIERAAHLWMEQFQNTGFMHKVNVNEGVHPVESYLCPVDCEIGGQAVKRGTWR